MRNVDMARRMIEAWAGGMPIAVMLRVRLVVRLAALLDRQQRDRTLQAREADRAWRCALKTARLLDACVRQVDARAVREALCESEPSQDRAGDPRTNDLPSTRPQDGRDPRASQAPS